MKDTCIWEDMHSTSSEICQFHSLHIVHIKHKEIRFQISEFSPRHCHPHNKSRTFSCKTQWTPNILKIKLHNSKAMLQWIKRWSTVTLLQRHIQHLLTIEKTILMRFSFSQVRIYSRAAVQLLPHLVNSLNQLTYTTSILCYPRPTTYFYVSSFNDFFKTITHPSCKKYPIAFSPT